MADAPRLRIPDQQTQPLRALLELPADRFEELLSVLKSEPPALDPDELVERVGASLPELEDPAGVVEVLLTLDLLRGSRGESPEEIADALREARGMPGEAEEKAALSARLAAALAIPSLLVTAKAVDLLFSNERTFQNARIVTELRPVFGADASRPPDAGVLVHRLELDFIGRDGRAQRLHFALDHDDLRSLERVATRAQEKTRAMIAFASSAGLRLANPEDGNGSEEP